MEINPYDRLPQTRSFRVTSDDFLDGKAMPREGASEGAGGKNTSPPLSWYGFPPETRSFAITMYDADAPTPSGFWHWAIVDIPAGTKSLARGAGGDDAGLPPKAYHLRNDAGVAGYLGPAPPPGHGRHRYFIAVHAVDVESLGIGKEASPAYLSSALLSHTLGRALIVPWFEAEAQHQAA